MIQQVQSLIGSLRATVLPDHMTQNADTAAEIPQVHSLINFICAIILPDHVAVNPDAAAADDSAVAGPACCMHAVNP